MFQLKVDKDGYTADPLHTQVRVQRKPETVTSLTEEF